MAVLALAAILAGVAGLGAQPAGKGEDEIKLPVTEEAMIKAWLDAYPCKPHLKVLLKERYEAALTECGTRWKEFLAGRGTMDIMLEAFRNLRDAERELSPRKADQVAVLEAYWKRTKRIEEINNARYQAGRIPVSDWAQARYVRADAEIQLERAKAGKGPWIGA
jgi:hypothetical protein